jgi:hypothetical protein
VAPAETPTPAVAEAKTLATVPAAPVEAPVAPAAHSAQDSAPANPAGRSLNARYATLNAGLNDRLAFVKSLFDGDDHDYQRVVAYLATLESKAECETFIREAVQPEYDWSKCPDVAERFMNLVYARFD